MLNFVEDQQSISEQTIESNNVEFGGSKVVCGNGTQSCADGILNCYFPL